MLIILADKTRVAFALQTLLTFLQQKYFELDTVLTRTVNILTTNELVKLMTH